MGYYHERSINKSQGILEKSQGIQGQIQPLSKVGVHIRVRWGGGFTSDIPPGKKNGKNIVHFL